MYVIVMLSLMILWFVFCTICMVVKSKQAVKKANVGVVYHIKCEKCEQEREATYDEITQTKFAKTKKETVTVNTGNAAGVGRAINRNFAKKCNCQNCGKKTWHEITDYYDHAGENTKAVLPSLAIWFLSLVAFGVIMIFVDKIIHLFIK